jgi:amphi-Trp domain-containing protein
MTEKERPSREAAASRLHALADALARHNEVEFERGGLRFTVHVPEEVDFQLEIEIGEDERELEVEITWGSSVDKRRLRTTLGASDSHRSALRDLMSASLDMQSSNVVMSVSSRRTNFKAGSMRTRWTGTQLTWPQHWIIGTDRPIETSPSGSVEVGLSAGRDICPATDL